MSLISLGPRFESGWGEFFIFRFTFFFFANVFFLPPQRPVGAAISDLRGGMRHAAQMARTRQRKLRRLEGPSYFFAMCVGARRRSGARPCERFLHVGATDAFRNAHGALGAPRMRRSDAGAAHTIDGSKILAFLAV